MHTIKGKNSLDMLKMVRQLISNYWKVFSHLDWVVNVGERIPESKFPNPVKLLWRFQIINYLEWSIWN